MWEDQGEHIDKTIWEQIDNGVPWTDTRKFLMIVPIALCVSVSASVFLHVVASAWAFGQQLGSIYGRGDECDKRAGRALAV